MLPKLIVIAGTNASGKSGLGIELAKRYGGEIISADSRQVFTGLDLGSGKVTPEEMNGVPHHLLDVCAAGDFFSMADFQQLAYGAIDGVVSRGHTPFLVGGTGLYVDAVAKGYVLSDKAPDLAYRAHLETYATTVLYEKLLKLDPKTQIDPRNRNRVMRMLERIHAGDITRNVNVPRYDCLYLGVSWDRPTLYERIDERLERRLNEGMIEEVQGLLDAGVSEAFLEGLGLEYRFISRYLLGKITSRGDMIDQLALSIKQFSKRQMTWFRKNQDINWLDMKGDPVKEAMGHIDAFLAN